MPAEMGHRDGEDDDRVGTLALDEPFEVLAPPRRHHAPDRLAGELVEGALLGRILGPPQVAVTLQPCESVSHRGVGLSLAIRRIRGHAPPWRFDRAPTVRRDEEVDARFVQPLPELPPGRGAAVAVVEVDRRGDGEQLWGAHPIQSRVRLRRCVPPLRGRMPLREAYETHQE